MDIDKLYYFFAAAESESFTKAADRCHIAQTTMSKYIAQLEKETGCTLFSVPGADFLLQRKDGSFMKA